jgi:hypothetical protein
MPPAGRTTAPAAREIEPIAGRLAGELQHGSVSAADVNMTVTAAAAGSGTYADSNSAGTVIFAPANSREIGHSAAASSTAA